jgi:aryl-alcohol dehydrogenase-like predicted oxidoreductase
VQLLSAVAGDVGLSMAQLAVAWVLQNDNVASAIVGASRPEQLADNVKAVGVQLDEEIMRRVDEALDPVITRDPRETDRSSPRHRP